MDNGAAPTCRLKEIIIKIVSDYWHNYKAGILLSTLGKCLSEEGIDLRETLGEQKLGRFIRTELGDQLRVVRNERNAAMITVTPVEIGDAAAQSPSATAATVARTFPRFNSSVWLAFKRVLGENQIRCIALDPVVRFDDLPEGEPCTDGRLIITHDDIAQSGDVGAIATSITAWAEKNGVKLNQLTGAKSGGLTKKDKNTTAKNLLDLLQASLSPQDLGRITIPLDLVIKLSKVSV